MLLKKKNLYGAKKLVHWCRGEEYSANTGAKDGNIKCFIMGDIEEMSVGIIGYDVELEASRRLSNKFKVEFYIFIHCTVLTFNIITLA